MAIINTQDWTREQQNSLKRNDLYSHGCYPLSAVVGTCNGHAPFRFLDAKCSELEHEAGAVELANSAQ